MMEYLFIVGSSLSVDSYNYFVEPCRWSEEDGLWAPSVLWAEGQHNYIYCIVSLSLITNLQVRSIKKVCTVWNLLVDYVHP